MGLVEDQGVVAQQATVTLDLGEQDAVGHQLHQSAVADLVGEAHRVAHGLAQRSGELVGDALRDGARGQSPRLGVADGAADSAAEVEADLGKLRGLAGAGRAGHHDHLILGDGLGQVVAPVADGQVRVGDGRDSGEPRRHECFGGHELLGQAVELSRVRRPELLEFAAQAGGVAERQPVEACAERANVGVGRFRHSGNDRRRSVSPLRPWSGRRGVRPDRA